MVVGYAVKGEPLLRGVKQRVHGPHVTVARLAHRTWVAVPAVTEIGEYLHVGVAGEKPAHAIGYGPGRNRVEILVSGILGATMDKQEVILPQHV